MRWRNANTRCIHTVIIIYTHIQNWFSKSDSFDKVIRESFEDDIIKAKRDRYKHFEATPRGSLCLIILLDQVC